MACFPTGQQICCICRDGLINALDSLTDIATDAICNPGLEERMDGNEQGQEDNNEDDDADDLATEANHNEQNIAQGQMQLQREIFSWGIIPGPFNSEQKSM